MNEKMMFLVFHGFSESNGISKKIRYQVDALRACGQDVYLCYCKMDEHMNHIRMVHDNVIINYGNTSFGKLNKRFEFTSIYKSIINNNIKWVYIRHNHNSSPWMVSFLKKLKRAGVKTVLEIPTFPYDQEYNGLYPKDKFELKIDQLFRKRMAKNLYRIVTLDRKSVV